MRERRRFPETGQEPTLVIVSGLPATGKSTLAEKIAEEQGWPWLTKDRFKEQLYDAGSIDPNQFDWTAAGVLGAQAVAVLIEVTAILVRRGISVVIESNFRPHLAERDLGPLTGLSQARQVHCELDRERVIERYRSRFEQHGRHPVHLDSIAIHELDGQIDAGFGDPLPLAVPLLCVDTMDGYRPDLPEILAFCRA